MRTLIILVFTLATMAACGDEGPELPAFTGHWQGFATAGFNVEITARESHREVTGAGKFTGGPQGSIAFEVGGLHLHPDVVLTFRAGGFSDVSFFGTFDGVDRIRGRLHGAGFSDDQLTLNRR